MAAWSSMRLVVAGAAADFLMMIFSYENGRPAAWPEIALASTIGIESQFFHYLEFPLFITVQFACDTPP
jgi:hypothetical protein